MSRAKKMFWQFACNRFFIAHDGFLVEYEKLGGGNKDEEALWKLEFIANQLTKLSTDDFEPLHQLCSAKAGEAIPALLDVDEYGDDLSRFWYAFTLHDLARHDFISEENKKKAIMKAKELWQGILNHPVGITEVNRTQVSEFMLRNLEVKTAEGYVRDYAQSKLREANCTTNESR